MNIKSEYKAKGKGIISEYNQGPVRILDRQFHDPIFFVLFLAVFIVMLVFLIISSTEDNLNLGVG